MDRRLVNAGCGDSFAGLAMTEVDARGHRCPVPTLRLRKALQGLDPGERLTLLADDPMARIDVPHFLLQAGAALIGQSEQGKDLIFVVEKR